MTAADVEQLYRKSVEHIAANDDPGELSPRAVAANATVQLVADVFGRTPAQVATHVVRLRRRGQGK